MDSDIFVAPTTFAVGGKYSWTRGPRPITIILVAIYRGNTLYGPDFADMTLTPGSDTDPNQNPNGTFAGSLSSPTEGGAAIVKADGLFKMIPLDDAHDATPVRFVAR